VIKKLIELCIFFKEAKEVVSDFLIVRPSLAWASSVMMKLDAEALNLPLPKIVTETNST
jgi:hypothetical protein